MALNSFEIIENNPDFLVIHKLVPMSFHSESGEIGLFETVKQTCKLEKLFPVHRLDKVTTGLLIFAKTEAAVREFGRLFEQREVQKYYLALGTKKPSKKQGAIIGDMQAARRGAWKLMHTKENPAVTQFFSQSIASGLRVYVLKPHTGKTHQLRVALKSIGSPIFGDELYGGEAADRTYLHAFALSFNFFDSCYRFHAPPKYGSSFLTEVFDKFMADYKMPENLPWPKI